jgi:hypothetical protein
LHYFDSSLSPEFIFPISSEYDKNIDTINERIKTIEEQQKREPKILIILGKSFPEKLIKFSYIYHFHISLNEKYIIKQNIKNIPNYSELLKTNKITKFFNYKLINNELNDILQSNLNDFIDIIFNMITNDIQEKLYGKNFTSKLLKQPISKENDIDKEIDNEIDSQEFEEAIEDDSDDDDDIEEDKIEL